MSAYQTFLNSILSTRGSLAAQQTELLRLEAELASDPDPIERLEDKRPAFVDILKGNIADDTALLAALQDGPHKSVVRVLLAAADALDAGAPGAVLMALAHAAEYRGRQEHGSAGYWANEAENFRRASRQTTPF